MSSKPSQPVLGFNHNLKFGPRIYHVQTEDSGLPHAHYITHLFVGGNIIASMKTSYADKASDPELAKTVRSLMEAQHKQMVRRLVAGEFNEKVQQFAPHYEPGVLATGQTGPAAVNTAPTAPMATEPDIPRIAAKPPPPASKPLPARPASKPAPMAPPAVSKPAPPRPAVNPPRRPVPPPAALPSQPPRPPPRMPGAPLPETIRLPPTQLPMGPPPLVPMPQRAQPQPPPARKPVPPPPPPLSQNPFAPEAGFAGESIIEVPADGIPTLFAEELISEKSLDEVILAFLSADLEQPK